MSEEAKSKKGLAVALLLLLIVAGGGGGWFYMEEQKKQNRENLVRSFEKLNRGIAQGSTKDVAPYISMSFDDAGLKYREALKFFSVKPALHRAVLQETVIDGGKGLVSYKRTISVNGKVVQLPVLNEEWMNEDGKWKLVKLAAIDKTRMAKARNSGQPLVDVDDTEEPEEKPAMAAAGDEQKPEPIEPVKDEDGIAEEPVAAKDAGKTAEEEKIDLKKLEEDEAAEVIELSARLKDPLLDAFTDLYPSEDKLGPYSPDGKRDPFESLIAGFGEQSGAAPDSTKEVCDAGREKEYLEGFDLMAITMVGIIGGKIKYALMEAPNGNGYTVSEGMHLGRNCGKILSIQEDKLILAEKFMVRLKGFQVRKRELKLRQEEK